MEIGQLIEDNMRKNFPEKWHTRCGGDNIPRPFFKNQNWAYLSINSLKFHTAFFYCMLSWELSKYIETEL